MKTLYNKRHAGGDGERRSFAFFVVGGLAVLAAVFLIGLQAGRYIEKNAGSREEATAKGGPDNASDIRKEMGAYSEDAAGVRAVPPPDADNGAREAERSVTFPETLARKEPGPVPLVRPAPKPKTSRPGTAVAPAGKPYLAQSGVFRSSEAAQRMKARLSKAGYPARVVESRGRKGVLYRVLVGPYAARDAALKAVRKLKSELKVDAVVVRG